MIVEDVDVGVRWLDITNAQMHWVLWDEDPRHELGVFCDVEDL